MTAGVVDTTVLIHILRHNTIALNWLNGQSVQLSITPMSWMEVMFGAGSKAAQQESINLFQRFDMVFQTESDMRWAMQQLQTYRLSHGVSSMDCLIASVCYRLQVPLYTHNLKDMRAILGTKLVVQPY